MLVLLQATQDNRQSDRLVASVAQTIAEDAHGMASIADLDANHSLLGILRETAHAVALVGAGATQSVVHGRTVLHTWHFFSKPAQAKDPLHGFADKRSSPT